MNKPAKQMQTRWLLPRGQVLQRTLRSDPEQAYYVYIPHSGGHKAPLFASIHGFSRNPIPHTQAFEQLCERYGVVMLAPKFTLEQHKDYQRLGRVGRGQRADRFFEHCVAEVASLTGADSGQIYLFGYSGGAQFAHRYLMANPQRVARAIVVAAGWYTFPDVRIKYPYGIRSSRRLPGVVFNPEEFLRVPVTVLVGENDIHSNALRSNPRLDEQQGKNRVLRARKWVATMRAAAEAYGMEPRVNYLEVPGANHSFAQFCRHGALAERVFHALFGTPLDGIEPLAMPSHGLPDQDPIENASAWEGGHLG